MSLAVDNVVGEVKGFFQKFSQSAAVSCLVAVFSELGGDRWSKSSPSYMLVDSRDEDSVLVWAEWEPNVCQVLRLVNGCAIYAS